MGKEVFRLRVGQMFKYEGNILVVHKIDRESGKVYFDTDGGIPLENITLFKHDGYYISSYEGFVMWVANFGKNIVYPSIYN